MFDFLLDGVPIPIHRKTLSQHVRVFMYMYYMYYIHAASKSCLGHELFVLAAGFLQGGRLVAGLVAY